MDPHYGGNFTDSFQGMIPSYNSEQQEAKEFRPQTTDAGFSLMSNVLNTPFDGNHLYSDLDSIESPLDNNMAAMELYDPLDSNMISNQGSMFPPSTISQGIFNFDMQPQEKIYNNTLGSLHQDPAPDHNPILTQQTLQHHTIQSSNTVSHESLSTVDTSLLNPIPAQSFYNPTAAPLPTPVAIEEPIPPDTDNSADVAVNAETSAEVKENVEMSAGNKEEEKSAGEPVAHETERPTAEEATCQDAVADIACASNGGENEEEEVVAAQLEKCVREGCNNTAVINAEWEDEYCSNDCCVKHCKTVFNNWVQENLRMTAEVTG